MAAAFALGAEGIQMGTRFVSSAESPVHAKYKQAIVDADDTGTVMLNRKSTPCVRALKTERTAEIERKGWFDRSIFGTVKDVYFGGDMEASLALAGQTVGLIHEVLPVRGDHPSARSRGSTPSAASRAKGPWPAASEVHSTFSSSGAMRRGRNRAMSGQTIIAASTTIIGTSMMSVSLSAKRNGTPAMAQAIMRQRP